VSTPSSQLAEELLRRLAAALRRDSCTRAVIHHRRNLEALSTALQLRQPLNPEGLHWASSATKWRRRTRDSEGGRDRSDDRRLKQSRRGRRIAINRGPRSSARRYGLSRRRDRRSNPRERRRAGPDARVYQHRVGRMTVDRPSKRAAEHAAVRQSCYSDAVYYAMKRLGRASTRANRMRRSRDHVVERASRAVRPDRTALCLTSSKNLDNYTSAPGNVVDPDDGARRAPLASTARCCASSGSRAMHEMGKVRRPPRDHE